MACDYLDFGVRELQKLSQQKMNLTVLEGTTIWINFLILKNIAFRKMIGFDYILFFISPSPQRHFLILLHTMSYDQELYKN